MCLSLMYYHNKVYASFQKIVTLHVQAQLYSIASGHLNLNW